MDYLVYVSRDAENLQFLLWLRDYTRRFAELPDSKAALAPEWSPDGKAIAELAPGARSTVPRLKTTGISVGDVTKTASEGSTKPSLDQDRNGKRYSV